MQDTTNAAAEQSAIKSSSNLIKIPNPHFAASGETTSQKKDDSKILITQNIEGTIRNYEYSSNLAQNDF